MSALKHLFVAVIICVSATKVLGKDPSRSDIEQAAEKRLSSHVSVILEHYKQEDPVGIPGAPIPDPLPIPPMNHSFSVGRMNFKDVKLYGLKHFRIEHVRADIAAMKVEAALTIDKLDTIGNYTFATWLSRAKGNFTVKLKNVYIKIIATLEVQRDGSLEAQAMNMDITFKEMAMDFKGLGFLASMLQGMLNSVGSVVFDSIKPFILSEANNNVRKDINKEISKLPQKFTNSISPFDQLVAEARKKFRIMGYDPFKVADYNYSVGVFDVYLSHSWMYGVSSFHRTKDIVFEVRNKTVHMLIEVGTQKLKGVTHWEVALVKGFVARYGFASFTAEYIKVQINASQSMDTRKLPSLDDIQIELGNIQTRFDGLGTIDYLVEFGLNFIPNLIRYQIMDAIEKPIKTKIQEELNKVNVEQLIKEKSKQMDSTNGLIDFNDLF